MRMKRGKYEAALECKSDGNGRSPRKPASGIVRYDSAMWESGGGPTGNRTRFALVGGEYEKDADTTTPAPCNEMAPEDLRPPPPLAEEADTCRKRTNILGIRTIGAARELETIQGDDLRHYVYFCGPAASSLWRRPSGAMRFRHGSASPHYPSVELRFRGRNISQVKGPMYLRVQGQEARERYGRH
ncbi:hypothetical protein PR048_008980 [Dryococelus australis]|uniref:Uncharacterized protein n=1 Tax=Dryococelus australis TaxID=614101 RepID=A0ABQ9HYM2_9NEOP|nr:hypothetical protein PR048_008980 [Dryococelus australis]